MKQILLTAALIFAAPVHAGGPVIVEDAYEAEPAPKPRPGEKIAIAAGLLLIGVAIIASGNGGGGGGCICNDQPTDGGDGSCGC